jgi:hypothetical protein
MIIIIKERKEKNGEKLKIIERIVEKIRWIALWLQKDIIIASIKEGAYP